MSLVVVWEELGAVVGGVMRGARDAVDVVMNSLGASKGLGPSFEEGQESSNPEGLSSGLTTKLSFETASWIRAK